MKVQLLTDRVGLGFAQSAGDVVNVSDAEGKALISAGSAIPADGKKESAMLVADRERTITHRPIHIEKRENIHAGSV